MASLFAALTGSAGTSVSPPTSIPPIEGNAEAGPSRLPATTERKKKIPKVAVYVSGAAFAITVGLTLLIIPYARQAARMNRPPQEFLSNRHLHLRRQQLKPSSLADAARGAQVQAGLSELEGSKGQHDPEGFARTASHDPYHSHNDDGHSENTSGNEEVPVGGLLAFQAFGIATALVCGSAGLGVWVTAKLLGVKDMTEFTARMRETLTLTMPGLTSKVAVGPGEKDDLGEFLDDMAREPEGSGIEVQGQGQGGRSAGGELVLGR